MARGCSSVVRIPPARESNEVTISPSCLKGDGGGFGHRRFCGKAVAASRVRRAADRRSRDVERIGGTFVLLCLRGLRVVRGRDEGWRSGPRLADLRGYACSNSAAVASA